MLKQIKKFSDLFGVGSYKQDPLFGHGDSSDKDEQNKNVDKSAADKGKRKPKKIRQLTFQEEAYIMTLISAETQTELAPAIKPIFEQGKETEIISNLDLFIRNREQEIEKICQTNFGGFIRSVDDLFAVRRGIEEVKHSVILLNDEIQSTGATLSTKLKDLVESRVVIENLSNVLEAITSCLYTLSLTRKVKEYIENKRFYPAIKILEQIQQVHLLNVSRYEFGRFLERKIPLMKESIKKRVLADVSSWLLVIRNTSGEIGRFSMAQTNATIEKKEELLALRSKDVKEYTDIVITQRKRGATILKAETSSNNEKSTKNGEKSSKSSNRADEIKSNLVRSRSASSSLSLSGLSLISSTTGADITEVSVFEIVNINFAPLYQCSYIHEVLGEKEEFQRYYKENRKLQAQMVLQQPAPGSFMNPSQTPVSSSFSLQNPNTPTSPVTSNGSSNVSSNISNNTSSNISNNSNNISNNKSTSSSLTIPVYAAYLNAIAGFFIIEATVLQTSNDLISVSDVTALWDMASNKMRAVLQVEVAYCEDVTGLPELKNYLLIFCRTLRKYGYNLNMMNDFVKTALRDRYLNVILDRLTANTSQIMEEPEASISLQIRNEKDFQEEIVANDLLSLFRDKNKKTFPFSIALPHLIRNAKQFTSDLHKFCLNLPDSELVVLHGLEQYLKIIATTLQNRDYNMDPTIANLGFALINSHWFQLSLPILEAHLLELGVTSTLQVAAAASPLNKDKTFKLDSTPFVETSRILEEKLYDINARTVDTQFEGFLKTCQPQSGKPTTGPRPHIQQIFKEINETFPKLADLPGHTFESMYQRQFHMIADRMMGLLLTDRIRYFDLNYVKSLYEDLVYVEAAASKAPIAGLEDNFAELRQVIHLLMQPEQKVFLDPPTRATTYNKITNTKKLAAILKKFKEAGGFGPFSAAKSKRKAVKAVMAQIM